MPVTFDQTLNRLPTPSAKRMALHVKPAAERALRDGHPWVFEGSIRKQSFEGNPGDLAVIFDQKDRFLAVGLYDPDSEIRVKVLQHNTQAVINADWFRQTIGAALAKRASLARSEATDGYRLIYGEGDGLPGLIVDRYAETLVVKLYTRSWLPHLHTVLTALLAQQPAARVVLRLARSVGMLLDYGLRDGMVLYGDSIQHTAVDVGTRTIKLANEVVFYENGLRFAADVQQGHKTGFFFDQRENRQQVEQLAAGQQVLDVFSYTGGFSVYAARGGARSVLSMDVSEPALQAAKKNMVLNRDDASVANVFHEIMVSDAFAGLEELNGWLFDMIIIDPPAFAKRQAEVPGALASYTRLAKLGTALLKPGGTFVMASCSSRVPADAFLQAVQAGAENKLRIFSQTAHAPDHPATFPEGNYLKCLYAKMSD